MEIISLFKGYSLEVVLFAFLTFAITELIKLPIKKATQKFEETKRKTINMVILLIPLLLAFVECVLYYGITTGVYFSTLVLASSISVFVLSLSIYAIASRLFIAFKCLIEGKTKLNSELSKETIDYIRDKIKELLSNVKMGEKEVSDLTASLDKLASLKKLLSEDTIDLDLDKLANVEADINNITSQIRVKSQDVLQGKEKIEKYKALLFKK